MTQCIQIQMYIVHWNVDCKLVSIFICLMFNVLAFSLYEFNFQRMYIVHSDVECKLYSMCVL